MNWEAFHCTIGNGGGSARFNTRHGQICNNYKTMLFLPLPYCQIHICLFSNMKVCGVFMRKRRTEGRDGERFDTLHRLESAVSMIMLFIHLLTCHWSGHISTNQSVVPSSGWQGMKVGGLGSKYITG